MSGSGYYESPLLDKSQVEEEDGLELGGSYDARGELLKILLWEKWRRPMSVPSMPTHGNRFTLTHARFGDTLDPVGS